MRLSGDYIYRPRPKFVPGLQGTPAFNHRALTKAYFNTDLMY